MILGCTGHRLHLLPGYKGSGSSHKLKEALLVTAMDKLEAWQPALVISGMATGWDMAVAAAAMFLNIPFRAYVPFVGQEKLWGEADKVMYRSLMDIAEEVRVFSPIQTPAAYHERDRATVDDSTELLALWCGDWKSGTGQTLRYANDWLVPWTNCAEDFMAALAKTAPRP